MSNLGGLIALGGLLVSAPAAHAGGLRAVSDQDLESAPPDREDELDTGIDIDKHGPEGVVSGVLSDFEAVVAIYARQPDGTFGAQCSGVRIRNDIVMTARHCISPDLEASDVLMSDQRDLAAHLFDETPSTIPGNLAFGVAIEAVSDAPWASCAANPDSLDSFWTEDCGLENEAAALAQKDDLVLLWFDGSSDLANGVFVPNMPVDYEVDAPEISHRFVGYGRSGDCGSGPFGRRLERTEDTSDIAETYLEVADVIGTGDSGGATLYDDHGLWMLAGINSSCSAQDDDPTNPPRTGRVARANTADVLDWLGEHLDPIDPPICSPYCVGSPPQRRCTDGFEMSWEDMSGQDCEEFPDTGEPDTEDGDTETDTGCGGCATGSMPNGAPMALISLCLLVVRRRRGSLACS